MVLNVNQRGFQRRLAVVEQILQSHDLRVSECCCHEAEFDCLFANAFLVGFKYLDSGIQ